MENKRKKDEREKDKDISNRINIIKEILIRFNVLSKKENDQDNISKFEKEHIEEIEEIKDYFQNLNTNEIAYIINLFSLSDDRKNEIIINLLDTMNSILSHYEYYKKKNPKIKYNNSHFDNYLLKRYDCSYIFTTYLSERDCRELKIDNKLYFNYIPIKCLEEHPEDDIETKQNCGFAHNVIELKFHPFVYKKFKCNNPNCNKDGCYSYHTNNDGEPLDMETEVDFDSKEIKIIKDILSELIFTKKGKDSKYKAKEKNDFIPTEFNPLTYKMYRCPLGPICKLDRKLCLNYHSKKDKRRNPILYKAEFCPNLYDVKNKCKPLADGKCDSGDKCKFAHNKYEYFYHPDKFRKLKCKQEDDPQNNKQCRERLICPYYHESDQDYGEGEEKMVLDPELIYDYYKSLMVSYEKSIDSETKKLKEIKNRYVCYKCNNENALDKKSFYVYIKEQKIICEHCKDELSREDKILFQEIEW